MHAFIHNYVCHFYFLCLHYYIFHTFLSIIALQKSNAKEEMGKLSKVNNAECSLIEENYSFILFLWIPFGQMWFLSWLCPFSRTWKHLFRYWWLSKSYWDMEQSTSFFNFLDTFQFSLSPFFSVILKEQENISNDSPFLHCYFRFCVLKLCKPKKANMVITCQEFYTKNFTRPVDFSHLPLCICACTSKICFCVIGIFIS